MSAKTEKMYKDSPKLERNEKGKMHASKKPEHKKEHKKEDHKEHGGHNGVDLIMHHKHAAERMELHHKHEKEHAAKSTPEHAKAVMELHAKHEKEHQALQAEHMNDADQPSPGGVGATASPGAETAQGE